MKRADFEKLLAKLQEEELQINQSKGREYAQGDDDALRNFKLASLLLGDKPIVVTPEIVCWLYLFKHFMAITEFVRNGDVQSDEPIRGRVNDIRLYTALLEGLVEDTEADIRVAYALIQGAREAMIDDA